MIIRIPSWLKISVCVALLLTGCKPRETNVETGNRTHTLHRGMGPALADLDPHLATGTTDYNVLSALFEGLVAEDPVDLHPVPGVAESWTVSADGITYTFHLRTDAVWSNGDPLTAQNFVNSWQRVLTPSLTADYANLLYVLAGARAYHQGETTDFSTVGVAAPDRHTLRVTLAYPAPYFLSLLQHWMWYPVHLPSIAAVGSPTTRGTPWARPGTMVCNGPFELESWQNHERIVVRKNPFYWDADTVRLDAIHFHPFEGVDTEERAFRSGQIHLTDALPIAKIVSYREDKPELLRIDPYLGTYFFRFNTSRPFLDNQFVRRALSLAVDRTAIVEKVLRGGQIPSAAFTPTGTAGYQPPEGLRTDFDQARNLLMSAGYPMGRGAPSVEILFNTSENHKLVGEAIQEMWRRELGLEVTLRNMENKTVLSSRRAGDFDVLRSVWIADYADPTSFLDVWRGDSGNNYTGWADADYDALLSQAARAPNQAARFDLLQRAESLLLERAPIIPIYTFTHIFVKRPEVRGWHPTLLDHHPYKHVWLVENPEN
ncbi:peptide ABC transporter substrate-binding protein [Synoicihabitans lomoniglobus]|uniref:Peptide ABC transporter substrate-binding protein n=1 Tax=Synoicihabitans lomoniglobus TaxID=2909285 RepID=A0AAF0CST1_9BACT|nr:peptide ABC transporter substrate-binding protein [Opitutaceae bacterium LMO-M01]WED67478.1 peptide ABC transporter substrate-binding protein [Opitutaceae bacterium LMO-M01]